MDTLATLIKLNRFKLDEQRRILVAIERRLAALADQAAEMEAEIEQEKAEAARDGASAAAFPAFTARWLWRRRALALQTVEIEAELAAARDMLAEGFRSLKQYELAAEARAEAARLESGRRQQTALDEISLSMFRQSQGDAD